MKAAEAPITHELPCDYLIIGAGTSNLSFLDTLLDQLPNATFILADRFSSPGGHWTKSYPFVRLHQPSCSYGVNSLPLGTNLTKSGAEDYDSNDRATGKEVCGYYGRVVDKMKATKRVEVYFNTEYVWNEDTQTHQLISTTSDESGGAKAYTVNCTKIVKTETRVVVPSMRNAPFHVDKSVSIAPINALPKQLAGERMQSKYVVIGAGKTGTDAILYLLENGVDQGAITWIISRDIWYFIRDGLIPNPIPGKKYWKYILDGLFSPLMESPSAKEFFLNAEKTGSVGRIDPDASDHPVIFKGAMIDKSDLERLRLVEDTVRLGRVNSISTNKIILDRGTIPFSSDSTLIIDCMAEDFFGYYDFEEDFEVFNTGRIRLGPLLFIFNPSATSAIIAFLESEFYDDSIKNSFLYFFKGKKKQYNDLEVFILVWYYHMKTVDQISKHKPAFKFLMSSRTFTDAPMHHGGILPLLWAYFGPKQLKRRSDAFKKIMEGRNFGGIDPSIHGKSVVDPKVLKSASRPRSRRGKCSEIH